MANRNRDDQRAASWRGVLKRHATSGVSVRAFCRREGLSEPSFYAWRRTLGERDAAAEPASQPAFFPAAILPSAGRIEIELRGGRLLRLPESLAMERLAELVRALEAAEAST